MAVVAEDDYALGRAVPLKRDLELAARVSHDLRIPLTTLRASLELLEDATEASADPAVQRLVLSSQRSVDRMTGLIDGLMRLYEVTENLRITEVDLSVVAQRVATDLGPQLKDKGALLEVDSLPVVGADSDLIFSVLLNLVSNALKFAPSGYRPEITIEATRLARAWRISVADNGAGIPENQREKVFEMFTRLSDRPGHGIGLTTVALIMQAHGGEVGVSGRSDLSHGTEFWFVLPD